MELTMFIFALAGFGLDIVIASPIPTIPQLPANAMPSITQFPEDRSPIPTSPQFPASSISTSPRHLENHSPVPTSPPISGGHHTIIIWDPPNAYYKTRPHRRYSWEKACEQALLREGCDIGLVHKGQSKIDLPNGEKMHYLNVVGAPMMNMEDMKKMRVFKDGSSTLGWSEQDRDAITAGKRRRRNTKSLPEQLGHGRTASLSWSPIDAYKHYLHKKSYWESRCDQALNKAGCGLGTIHQGETKVMRNGQKISYVKVEAAPSTGMEGKEMRVFSDGTYEDGWSARDLKLISDARRPRGPRRRRGQRHKGPVEASTSSQPSTSQENTEVVYKHRISWDPPNPYEIYPRLRQSYEKACDQALEREGCDFGIIRPGQHGLKSPDGTKLFYMDVSAGRDKDLGKTRYMKLFEDGTSQWYPPGQQPKKDYKRERKARLESGAPTRKRRKKQNTDAQLATPAQPQPPPYQAPGQTPYQSSSTEGPSQHTSSTEFHPTWRLSWTGSEPHFDWH